MTNAESYLKDAVRKLNDNELNAYEASFIDDIKDYTKKDLRKLSYKQFCLLRKIAES
jgi:hypothetical protein